MVVGGRTCWSRSRCLLFLSGTFNVNCHECVAENTFDCSRVRTCQYHVRRCMTVAARKYLSALWMPVVNRLPGQFRDWRLSGSLSVPWPMSFAWHLPS